MGSAKNIVLALVVWTSPLYSLIDFEESLSPCIVETKQIIIPGFPGAFNASAIHRHGKILLCFRIRDNLSRSTGEVGMVWLDENFDPVSTPQLLQVTDFSSPFTQIQDPRLITVQDHLYLVYSNYVTIQNIITRRVFVASIYHRQGRFFMAKPVCLHSFEGAGTQWEKNWVPFVHNNELLFAYSICPHRILQPKLSHGACPTQSISSTNIIWDWGEVRGGTPALRDDNEYIAFFHSSKKMASVHSQGISMPHYVMGAYTFSAKPPFAITRMSAQPLVGQHFYNGPAYTTWKPLRVVFPMGILKNDQYIWVTYGRQDFEIWVAKIDRTALYKSLTPCTPQRAHCIVIPTGTPIVRDAHIIPHVKADCV